MKCHRPLFVIFLLGLLPLSLPAQDPGATPPGWTPGQAGPIYLRLDVGVRAPHAVYLKGLAGWNWPRPVFRFYAAGEGHVEARANWRGEHMRPSGQAFPTNSAACIPPGGQSPWIEIPAASLGNAWANRLTLTYPGNLPQVDVPVTLELAARPDEAAVAARRSFDIGPSQPTVTLLVHRWLKDAAARTFTELADETQRLARERLVKPVYGKRPEKFPCLTTLAIDRTIYPKVWFRPWTLANVIRQLDAHYPAYLAKPLYTINMTSDAFMNTGSMTAHGVDLLHSIRLAHGVRDMGVEGWKNLTASYQFISWEMEMIRCGTRHKTDPGLQLAAVMHRQPLDIEFAVYSSLAHGMNYLSYFSYGPWYAGGDHASEKDENFPVIRRINYAIGGIEDLLLASRPRPAQVALLYAMPTDVWTWGRHGANTAWLAEHIGLFLALQHAQIPVEILAEEDVVGGELAKFKVLYIVGPNITSAAAGAIAAWVRDGGTLIGTAAAGSRDEYDRPLDALAPVFGARQGEVHFATIPRSTEKLYTLPLLDYIVTDEGQFENAGLRIVVTPLDGATRIRGRFFSDDAPALLERRDGKGRALLLAGLPGLTYLRGGTVDKEENPGRYADCYSPGVYPAALREAIAAPVHEAGVRPPVEVGVPVVEAGLRESGDGAVVVLVNYPRQPLADLKLLIHGIKPARVRSVTATTLGIELPFAPRGDAIEVVLPTLSTTEMLAIRY